MIRGAAANPAGEAAARKQRWWTVRMRLTALYGVLFLVSSTALLGVTYVLVDRATSQETVSMILPDGRSASSVEDLDASQADRGANISGQGSGPEPAVVDPAKVREFAESQHAHRMRTLLAQSAVALGMMSVFSIALGWMVAGRVLRPVRTITQTTRRITANNLHERLALTGPHDDLRNLGDTIDDLLTRLDRSFRAQQLFVANASHELRTPLARQRTIAQVALDDPEATAETLRIAHDRVLAAGAQQEHLIESLLTLARGQIAPDRTATVDLGVLAGEVVAAHQDEAATRGVRLSVTSAQSPVHADPGLIQQLISNLIENAVRHNLAGGVAHVTTIIRERHSVLSVTNSGTLVATEAIEELVEPFRRLESGRTGLREGHGLGLAIVKAIADVHHAQLSIRARPHGGLDVSVSFPPVAAD